MLVVCVLWSVRPAAAGPRGIDVPIPFDPSGGLSGVTDACNNLDAPMPASPYGDGSFIVRITALGAGSKAGTALNDPAKVDDELDPFRNNDEVSLESAYGTAPQWWSFDNGCTGQFIADAGTSIGNILLQVSGILPNWSHALLNAVIGDNSFLKALDDPIVTASQAVTDGVWAPWLSVVLLLVAAVVMLRARDGRIARAVTATGWALGVLVVTSWLIQYPVESTRLVDDGVRSATGLIAAGFNDGKPLPGVDDATFGESDAVRAVDGQMDEVVRATQYRTWLAGVFGDPDSQTAKTYGPRVFRATHFSWREYDLYRKDPNGEGKQVLDAKQDAFKKHAEAIKKADPVAYEYFKGEHWSQRATSALVNLVVVVVTCGFLLAAGLAILLSFALIRLIVPFAPAAGVLFMLDHTRDAAVAMLKRVVGPLVMGPIYFLVALLLLRLDSAILTSSMWFVLKLGLIAVLTVLAWRLNRPAAYLIPGTEPMRRALRQRLAIGQGVRDEAEAATARPAAVAGAVSPGRTAFIPGYTDRAAHAGYGYVIPERERPDVLPLTGAPARAVVPGVVLASTNVPVRQRGLEQAKPDARYPGGYVSAWPAEARRQWVARHITDPSNVKPETREGPAYDYQRKHAGPNNIVLRGGGAEIDADGLTEDPDKVVTIEAKYVNRPGASNAVNEGRIPPFMKEKIEREFKSEMIRYGKVMNDPSNPVDRLRLTVSTTAAGEYWGRLAREHLGPDADVEIRLESD